MLTSSNGTPAGHYAFGTMQFGGSADEAASAAMFEASRAAGITHFDTAFIYTDGASEQILGRLAAPERDSLTIATKVAFRGGDASELQRQFDICRRRLDMDVVDILYLHRYDGEAPFEHVMDTFAGFREAGQIRYIGLSNLAAWQVMKMQAVARGMGLRIDIIQPMYNLVKRQAEVEILPMASDQGIAVAPYSPLGGGLLTGKYLRGETGRLRENSMYADRYAPDWMSDAARGLVEIAAREGVDPATLAVAWVARHPTAPWPILSARSVEQLAPSLAAIDFRMSDALYAEISALSPAPPPATDRLEEQA